MGGGSGGIAQCFMIGVLISKFNYLIEFSCIFAVYLKKLYLLALNLPQMVLLKSMQELLVLMMKLKQEWARI